MIELIRLISSDLSRYRRMYSSKLSIILFSQGFIATFYYRVFRYLYISKYFIARVFAKLSYQIVGFWITNLFGITLPIRCNIGKAVYFPHNGGIILHPDCIIGDYSTIFQGVTIGSNGRGTPTIGNKVYIGANALVLGKIEIGDEVVIGAGSVVTKSLPPKAVVVGNPFKIISYNGSSDIIKL